MIRKRSLKFSFIITCCILSGLLAGCGDNSPPTFTLDEPDVDDISLLATLSVSNENPGGPTDMKDRENSSTETGIQNFSPLNFMRASGCSRILMSRYR